MTFLRRHLVVCAGAAVALLVPALARAQARPVLTLDAALAEALQHSPELQPRADAVRAAGIQRRLAASQFAFKIAPSFMSGATPGGYVTRQSGLSVSKRLATGADTFVQVSSYSVGQRGTLHDTGYTVGISQPLLRGFTRTATADLVTASRAAETAARALDVSRASLVVNVTSRYFSVLKQQRLVAAAEQAADRAKTLRVASEARTTVGLATELDVLRAQVLESQMLAAATAARTALGSALDELLLTIGKAPGDEVLIEPPADLDAIARLDALPTDLDALVQSAMDRRVDLREARDRIADAKRSSDIARWTQLPPVSLDVSYTQRGVGSPSGEALNALAGGWRIGLGSTYATDRAAEAAASETAAIAMDAATRDAEAAASRVAAEVRQAHRQWQAAGATVEIQQKAVDLAQRQLRLAQLRFERGLGGSLEVVDAQNSVLQTQNGLIAAQLDRAVFALELQRASGLLDTGRFGWYRR